MVTVALLCVFGVGTLLTGRVSADDCMGSSSQVSGSNRQHTYVCIAAKPSWDRVPHWCMRSSCLVNVSAVVYPLATIGKIVKFIIINQELRINYQLCWLY